VLDFLAAFTQDDSGFLVSKNALESQLMTMDHTQKAIRDGIARAVKDGFVTVTEGPRRAKLHGINHPCSECGFPVASKQERHLSCPSGHEERRRFAEGLFE
jgi:hypothetical protein